MSEFTDLAAEIAADTGADAETAYRLAWEQMGDLLNDVMTDVRYIPRRVVMIDQLLTARELKDWTER
jgi:hypothetical protein